MEPITPRWEWRTFAHDFGPTEARIRQHPIQVRRSAETYILSDHADANTKIRDQLLDVKALQQIDTHGLEQWLPLMKAAFPLAPATIESIFGIWKVQPPALGGEMATLDHFLERLVRPEPSLAVVGVTKLRGGCEIDGCLVEIADLKFDGTPVRTIAVEMADPDRVWRTVLALGLSAHENVSYVTALKRFLAVHTR